MSAIYGVMILGGLFGILGHTFIAARNINKRLKAGSIGNVFGELWRTDYLSVIGGVLFFGTLLFISSDFINFTKIDEIDYSIPLKERILHFQIANFIKTSSVLGGYFAESIMYGIFGKVEDVIKIRLDNLKIPNN